MRGIKALPGFTLSYRRRATPRHREDPQQGGLGVTFPKGTSPSGEGQASALKGYEATCSFKLASPLTRTNPALTALKYGANSPHVEINPQALQIHFNDQEAARAAAKYESSLLRVPRL